jgi:hypothetical protein
MNGSTAPRGSPVSSASSAARDCSKRATTYLANKAKTTGELLTLMKVIVPIVLVVIGVLLLVIAILRRHKPGATPAAARAADGAPEPQPESSRLDTGPAARS